MFLRRGILHLAACCVWHAVDNAFKPCVCSTAVGRDTSFCTCVPGQQGFSRHPVCCALYISAAAHILSSETWLRQPCTHSLNNNNANNQLSKLWTALLLLTRRLAKISPILANRRRRATTSNLLRTTIATLKMIRTTTITSYSWLAQHRLKTVTTTTQTTVPHTTTKIASPVGSIFYIAPNFSENCHRTMCNLCMYRKRG